MGLAYMTRRAPNTPGICILDDGLGLFAKRIEHIPNSDRPAIRMISNNAFYSQYERTVGDIRVVGQIRSCLESGGNSPAAFSEQLICA